MGHQDYFEPVRYQPPPRTPRRFPRWVLVLLAIIVVTIGLGYGVVWYWGRDFSKQMKELLPAPAVVIGQPLAWRELDRRLVAPLSPGMMGGMFVDDFDADGDQEILVIRQQGESDLYEADTSKSTAAISGTQFMLGGASWDYDRDGVAEVVVGTMLGDVERGARQGRSGEEIFMSQDLPVFNLAGNEVARVSAAAGMSRNIIIIDIDGDGWSELIAPQPESSKTYGGSKLRAFGANGKQLSNFSLLADTYWAAAGDVDGDGRQELLALESRLRELGAIRPGQDPETLYTSPDAMQLLGCADLNGDGCDEVILSQGMGGLNLAYFDCASKQLTSLQAPATRKYTWEAILLKAHAGTFLNAGETTIAVAGAMYPGILLFSTAGQCVYYEELGDMLWSTRVLHSGGRDYLVVQLSERLLIYP